MAMSAQPTTATQSPRPFFAGSQTNWPASPPRSRLEGNVARFGTPSVPAQEAAASIEVSPANAVTRRQFTARGITVEIVEGGGGAVMTSLIRHSSPVLVAYDRGLRGDGESAIDGLPSSSLRDLSRRLTFVPAGKEHRERHAPLFDVSALYIYFDPIGLNDPTGRVVEGPWSQPRLFFEDAVIWDTVMKIKGALSNPAVEDHSYVEALALVLAREIMRAGAAAPAKPPLARGGLAAWQQRKVAAFIEEHFAEPVTLATMAELVGLSPYYFCRAFKQSFGTPPHRYLSSRRIERAKRLLIEHKQSITHIALEVGFDETSSFSAAFRKATGLTPTAYQRSAG